MLDPIKEGAVWAIMFLPLASFAIITLVSFLGLTRSGAWSPRHSGYLTVVAIFASFLLSLWALDSVADSDGARIGFGSHEWLTVGGLEVNMGITLDGLTGVMLVVVTGVSLLVQIYSQEYMRDDEGYNRYFAFMSLFTASMLGLVLASSVLQLFVFWELVGLCSYLLIGFWFQKDSARRAAVKAFMVTRVGDLGFMIALLIVFTETGSLEIGEIHEAAIAGAIGSTALTFFALGLFAGAAGKSAQFPLHTWLPDAMEGPTPVSALIHAATMVAAGVYLVARFYPVFAVSEDALLTIAIIGSITTIGAALLGIVATDIKRVMAYSTISQLGYMMMGLGVGGMVAAIFHLFTHAFFKALLFLGAGSVIHATEKQELDQLGGLASKMPLTTVTFAVGTLAMIGIVPLAGFWAKDEILHFTEVNQNAGVYALMLLSVFITSLFMTRLFIRTFLFKSRDPESREHAHDAEPAMTVPLLILAALAAISGFVVFSGVGEAMGFPGGFGEFVFLEHAEEFEFNWDIVVLSTVLGAGGMMVGYVFWANDAVPATRMGELFRPVYNVLYNGFYIDNIYQFVIDRII
ncbi:MAG: NADH-quinone oxidoreductase subunit L, partial [Chloroflexi bacterium]|nr:NADH-quinone oxidoreductase subunit L [Chloroflexota bacterium]